MKKLLLIIIMLFVITGCGDKKVEETANVVQEEKIEAYDFEKITPTTKNYDMTDADENVIFNIFSLVGTYKTISSDETRLCGYSFDSLYKLMKQLESSNKFASLYIKEADKVNVNELNNLELDVINGYIKWLFEYLNRHISSVDEKELITIESIGKATKVYVWNYDSNYNTKDDHYMRDIILYYEKSNQWIQMKSQKTTGDNNYVYFFKDVNMEEFPNFVEIDPELVNNVLRKNYDYFHLLIQYRNNVFAEKIKKDIAKNYKSKPQIGMTKSQVRDSSWGSPNKINKDTYSWGTTEQWVYDYGYVYFKNGVVTSISER